jgi:predicted regulator of Ras-like GTPase activity (Roadblock/LC7/MglB family)
LSLKAKLQQLGDRVEGVIAVALVAEDGILVDSIGHGNGEVDLEALAAELVTHVRLLSHERRGLAAGKVRRLSVATDRYTIVASDLEDDYYLVAVLDDATAYGRLRFELRRAGILFADEF